MEALGFGPFGTMQTHHFICRQDKLQLAPYQTAFAVNCQQLIEWNKIFVAFTRDFYPSVEKDNLVVRMLRQALA
ncbi:hypothetical protein D3C87_1533100 [compost metagenome]